ncbi:cytidine deaminase [Tilletiaria anomala UBC 951]|uniref:Cytidine deaminase n=1 Tax=Tilletiaria anomala (strain ATCC 24038 / CBS 436.72 / UBC 951) TaxID=1037660 RepID=A0A066WEP4_TILAU|nr:cytidine deaminase [Tilletiaria anomala UBC 951]KDN52236.1 cytidine deaminase [Tilletiaria anomala UBC 951]
MALTKEQRDTLLLAAQKARDTSYSPYSKFRVGAALLLQSGKIIPGANVENASYGAAICAERTAMVTYVTSTLYQATPRDKIVAIAVSSDLDSPCSPCGICRQFIREFTSLDTPILMVNTSWKPSSTSGNNTGTEGGGPIETAEHLEDPYEGNVQPATVGSEKGVTVMTIEQLLPLSFGPDALGKDRSHA